LRAAGIHAPLQVERLTGAPVEVVKISRAARSFGWRGSVRSSTSTSRGELGEMCGERIDGRCGDGHGAVA
jgi:hypothetical protein